MSIDLKAISSHNQILYVAPDAFDGLNDVERIDLRIGSNLR